MSQKAKAEKKVSGLKVFLIIVLILAIIIGLGIGVICYMVRPVDDQSDKAVPVGGMLTSQNVEYKHTSAEGLENNLILKIMQIGKVIKHMKNLMYF